MILEHAYTKKNTKKHDNPHDKIIPMYYYRRIIKSTSIKETTSIKLDKESRQGKNVADFSPDELK